MELRQRLRAEKTMTMQEILRSQAEQPDGKVAEEGAEEHSEAFRHLVASFMIFLQKLGNCQELFMVVSTACCGQRPVLSFPAWITNPENLHEEEEEADDGNTGLSSTVEVRSLFPLQRQCVCDEKIMSPGVIVSSRSTYAN
eukprot:2478001-Amphidinium_carterae.1